MKKYTPKEINDLASRAHEAGRRAAQRSAAKNNEFGYTTMFHEISVHGKNGYRAIVRYVLKEAQSK